MEFADIMKKAGILSEAIREKSGKRRNVHATLRSSNQSVMPTADLDGQLVPPSLRRSGPRVANITNATTIPCPLLFILLFCFPPRLAYGWLGGASYKHQKYGYEYKRSKPHKIPYNVRLAAHTTKA
jgi:hypothetical protein